VRKPEPVNRDVIYAGWMITVGDFLLELPAGLLAAALARAGGYADLRGPDN
jgi:hypothetical protein